MKSTLLLNIAVLNRQGLQDPHTTKVFIWGNDGFPNFLQIEPMFVSTQNVFVWLMNDRDKSLRRLWNCQWRGALTNSNCLCLVLRAAGDQGNYFAKRPKTQWRWSARQCVISLPFDAVSFILSFPVLSVILK